MSAYEYPDHAYVPRGAHQTCEKCDWGEYLHPSQPERDDEIDHDPFLFAVKRDVTTLATVAGCLTAVALLVAFVWVILLLSGLDASQSVTTPVPTITSGIGSALHVTAL